MAITLETADWEISRIASPMTLFCRRPQLWKGVYRFGHASSAVDNFTLNIYPDNGFGYPMPPGAQTYSASLGSVSRKATGEFT